jgi:hypothetical protein
MTENEKPPGLTVGQLRMALAGYDPEMSVTVRFAAIDGEDVCGGILVAGVEHAHDEDDTPHFCIDASDDPEAFE